MPNLNVIRWKDEFPIDETFFKYIMISRASRVELQGVYISEKALPMLAYNLDKFRPWKVRSLVFDVGIPLCLEKNIPKQAEALDQLYQELMRLCAPTIQSFALIHRYFGDTVMPKISLGHRPIIFPHLHSFRFENVGLSSSALSTFLGAPLRHLGLAGHNWPDHVKALDDSEPLRDLETLFIPCLPESEECAKHVASFIERHSQVQTLYLHEHPEAMGDGAHLNSIIIPLLSPTRFQNLKSLSLGWGGGVDDMSKVEIWPHIIQVSDEALRTIGKLTSLEQLSLRVGLVEVLTQWLVDHDKMRSAFRDLKRLKKLAISRDTYPTPDPDSDVHELYYLQRALNKVEYDMADAYPEVDEELGEEDQRLERGFYGRGGEQLRRDAAAWERAHRNKMIRQAEMYVEVLPALEWIYLGQRPMSIRRDPDRPGRLVVMPMTRWRDECDTYLKQTFALDAF
ncbi:hypothetical protein M434DRAFT_392169, partial [Hypoxylon sp. CO27-5]